MGLLFALFGSLVEFLVIRERMRIRACHVRMNEGGSFARAAIFRGPPQDVITHQRIGSVAFRDVQARVVPNESRDAGARGLRFDRHRNGVAVVFDQKKHGQALQGCRVQGFEEFSLTGHAISAGHVNDFIRTVPHRCS